MHGSAGRACCTVVTDHGCCPCHHHHHTDHRCSPGRPKVAPGSSVGRHWNADHRCSRKDFPLKNEVSRPRPLGRESPLTEGVGLYTSPPPTLLVLPPLPPLSALQLDSRGPCRVASGCSGPVRTPARGGGRTGRRRLQRVIPSPSWGVVRTPCPQLPPAPAGEWPPSLAPGWHCPWLVFPTQSCRHLEKKCPFPQLVPTSWCECTSSDLSGAAPPVSPTLVIVSRASKLLRELSTSVCPLSP